MQIIEIVKLLKYALIGIIPCLLVAAGIMALQISNMDNHHKIKNGARRIKKNLFRLIGAAVIYLACFVCITFIESRISSYIRIGLNYEEASQGLYPNKTRFNTYDIINTDVLTQAIQEGGLGDIDPAQLRETLSVVPSQAGDTVSGEQYYVSTDYVLNYNATWSTLSLSGEQVVKSVAKAFYDQFNQQYSRKINILEIDFTDFEDMDYLDQVTYLRQRAADVQNYFWMCSSEAEDYMTESGETFASLATKVSDFQAVEVERVESYILTKGLSRDTSRQVVKLSYVNLMHEISRLKNMASYHVRLEAIDMYERDMASIVLVPTMDENGEYYMSRTKVGVDDFADEAETYSKTASQLQKDILDNNYAISQLSHAAPDDGMYDTAEEMIETARQALQTFADRGIEMVKDYDEKVKGDFLVFTEPGFFLTQTGFIKKAGILVLGMFCSLSLLIAVLPGKKTAVMHKEKK